MPYNCELKIKHNRTTVMLSNAPFCVIENFYSVYIVGLTDFCICFTFDT